MGITTDITHRRAHAQELRESGARMEAALNVAEPGSYELLNGAKVAYCISPLL